MITWIIGLSGSGKTTLGVELRRQILVEGFNCVLLDGDLLREIFGSDLGHTIQDRRKNADRISRLSQYLDQQGINAVCAVLSIFHESQDWNRANIPHYYEVFLDAPIEMVKKRDTKGIYQKAESGQISDVVGVDIPFPRPKAPNLVLQNNFEEPVESLAAKVLQRIRSGLHGKQER